MSESRREKEGSTRGHGRQLCAPRPKGHGNVKARVRHLDSPPSSLVALPFQMSKFVKMPDGRIKNDIFMGRETMTMIMMAPLKTIACKILNVPVRRTALWSLFGLFKTVGYRLGF